MKLKQTAIVASLIFSHLAAGANYSIPANEQLPPPKPDFTSIPSGELNNLSFEPYLPTSLVKSNQLRQAYLEVLSLLESRQLEASQNKINYLIRQNPDQAEGHNLQASLALLKKKPALAIASYQKAIKLDSENTNSHLGLATAFFQVGNFTQTKEHIHKALSINDNLPQAYMLLALIAYQENKQQDAENLLLTAHKKALGNSKQEVLVGVSLLKLYKIKKQPQKALAMAQDILKRHPDNSFALALLVDAQIFNNQPTEAISTLETLVKQEQSNTYHRFLLAKLLTRQLGNKQQVLKLLNEISTIAPEMGLAETLLGEVYLSENKLDLALTAFQKSYKIKPDIKAMNSITKIMLTQGKQADAIHFLSQELKKNPQNLTAHLRIGNIYQQQNNTHKAEKHYLAILAEQPDNVVILNNLAWVYYQQNNPKALTLAEKAYQKAPKSAAIADTYAVILVKQGDLSKGLQIFEKASKLAPQSYDIQYHLADAYALNGQTKKAVKILKTITSSEQKFSEQKAAVSLLKKLSQ